MVVVKITVSFYFAGDLPDTMHTVQLHKVHTVQLHKVHTVQFQIKQKGNLRNKISGNGVYEQ